MLAGVRTVGCRRVGGGLVGEPAESNVVAGAALAASLRPGALILEGSGACVPPVEVDRTVCVVGEAAGWTRWALPAAARRPLPADAPDGWSRPPAPARCASSCGPSRPSRVPAGARGWRSSAPAPGCREGVEPVVASRNLARRSALADDLDRAAAEGCDVYLTELKAAAIDTVAERARREGARVVFVRNRPVGVDGDLDEALLELADA